MKPDIAIRTNPSGMFIETHDTRLFSSHNDIPVALEIFRFMEVAKLPKVEVTELHDFIEAVSNFMQERNV